MKNIILASASPRRSELLNIMGLSFETVASDCSEETTETDPEKTVLSLARLKCENVAERIKKGSVSLSETSDNGYIVIGADTIVVYDGRILGKPKDEDDAYRMLKKLNGNTHVVYTAVAITDTSSGRTICFAEHTFVTMYPQSDSDIWNYVHTGEPLDKAGAYGIQGKGAVLVQKIDGDYFTVVGLPVARLNIELKKMKDC